MSFFARIFARNPFAQPGIRRRARDMLIWMLVLMLRIAARRRLNATA
jgi:hypothetical protein